ncbi:insulinase family protein, partial [bacterium]|nr:insulinase family protein [bacterium]
MALCVCGNVETDKVIEIVGEVLKSMPETIYKRADEIIGKEIVSKYAEEKMDVSLPVYSIGIKFHTPSKINGMKEFAAVELIMDLLFGKSSSFYTECYDAGVFEEMSYNYQTMRNAFFAEISGISRNPSVFYEKIQEYIKNAKIAGFAVSDFERARKSLYADTVFDYDSVENIADTFVSFYFEGDDMFDYPDIVADITKEYTEECLKKLFDSNNICLSVISPKKEEQQ